MVVNGQANMDDLLSARPTGVVRIKRDGAVVPFPVQNMGDTGLKMLAYMDKVRKEAAGAQLDIGTAESIPVVGQTAHGMERWMTSKEHLSSMIAKTFAETLIRTTYQIAHKLLKRYMPEMLQYQANGQFKETIPGYWGNGAELKIEIDTSISEKQKLYQALDIVINQQIKAIENQTSLTNMSKIYNAVTDQARLAGLEMPDRYWIDPESPEGKQIAQQAAQSAQTAEQKAQIEADKLYQTELASKGMEAETDRMKAMMQDRIDSDEQFRKWVEMELEYKTDVPGRGLDKGKNNGS